MIPPLLFWVTVVAIVAWCVGMVRLFRGKPLLALWSPIAMLAVSGGTLAIVLVADRYNDFLFGGLGRGDGMGMIGLILLTVSSAIGSLAALVIASIAHLILCLRAKSASKEV